MEDEVLANAGVDVFEEVFKLIFTKLYDENKSRTDKIIIDRIISRKNKNNNSLTLSTLNEILKDVEDDDFRRMEFRNTGQSEGDLKTKIVSLFNEGKLKWISVDLGDYDSIVFIIESDNHPSFIEPYQGAATGVGGIMRDVFTMGARPIANLNSIHFGSPQH